MRPGSWTTGWGRQHAGPAFFAGCFAAK